MITAFLQYLQYEKNFSSHTFLSYRNDLISFRDYVISQKTSFDVNEIDAIIIRGWILFLLESGQSSRTVNRKLSAIKSFYRFLNLKDYCNRILQGMLLLQKSRKVYLCFLKKMN